MTTFISIILVLGFALANPVTAGPQELAAREQATTKVEPAQAPTPKPAPAEKIEPSKAINVQIEITLTDQLGDATPTKKIVSLITTDGTPGRIRSGADSMPEGVGRVVPVILNVDALPRLMPGDLIRLNLTIEYRPLKAEVDRKADSTSPTALNQSLTVIMTSGKPMVVSQAADPVTDRKIVIEAKATILK